MSPLQIATAHCANHQPNGSCLGVMFGDDLRIICCRPKPKCLLTTRGVRCRYFEECLVPMARAIAQENYRLDFEDGIRQYQAATAPGEPFKLTRRCPDCGVELDDPKQRLCGKCAATRRLKPPGCSPGCHSEAKPAAKPAPRAGVRVQNLPSG